MSEVPHPNDAAKFAEGDACDGDVSANDANTLVTSQLDDVELVEPGGSRRFQRLMEAVIFAAVVAELLLVADSVVKLSGFSLKTRFWLFVVVSALGGTCWLALQWSYGRLLPEVKNAVLGEGQSFRSSSSLPASIQILVVLVVLGLAGWFIYFMMTLKV